MKKRRLGIYVDSEGIALAEAEGKNLSSSTFLSFSSLLEEREGSEELSSALKMEALLQKGLREVKTELKEAYVGFSEKESIFRLLELPYMSKKELKLALPLEIEKYIPFKIEEVAWDYKEKKLTKEKKIKIAFFGMKESFLEEMRKIFSNVGVEIKYIDSSSFSLVSFLISTNRISKKYKNFAFFSFSDNEAEISIFSENFPYFLRYIKFPLNYQGEPDFKKVGDELKITFEYYRREVGSKSLEKLFILGKKNLLSLCLEELKDLDIPLEPINLEEILVDKRISTLQELKAYSLALRDYQPTFLAFDILKEKEERGLVKEEVFKVPAPEEVPWNFKPVVLLLILGVLSLGGILFIENKKETAKTLELERIKREAKRYPFKIESLSLENLKEKEEKLKKALGEIKKNLEKIPKDNYSLVKLIGDNATEGMWLKEIRFRREEDLNKIHLSLQGYTYWGDIQKERESLNKFVDILKNSNILKSKHLEVNIRNIEQQELEDYNVTFFELEVK